MENFQTEEQQVDAIKGFWKDNGNGIIAGLVIGFSSFIGYGYYNEQKIEQEVQTAENYQAIIVSQGEDDAFTQKAESFIADNGDSSYAALTALSLAKEASSHKDWDKAEQYLALAVEKSSVEGIKGISTLRLARVQVQQEKYEEALTSLAQPLPESFSGSVAEIKGDIYLKQGKVELARTAYQTAMVASAENMNPVLQMKIDDLAQLDEIVK